MEKEFRNFSNRVYTTECARFEGYRRMKRRKLSSTVSLALLSLSIIAFNILQLCDGYEEYNQSITAVTIMLSVLVLVLSLLVSYLNYSEKELKYYECGIKLSALCDEIDLVLSDPQKRQLNNECLRELKNKYQRIIGECGINHIAIDHKRALLRIERNGDRNDRQIKDPNEKANSKGSSTQNSGIPRSNDQENDKHGSGNKESCCDKFINFLNSLCAKKKSKDSSKLEKSKSHRPNRFCVWIEWNIFDVNFLYWLLAIGIPILAWMIIFKSQVFGPAQSTVYLSSIVIWW